MPVTTLTPPGSGENVIRLNVRFRTVGDITCTAPVESDADSVAGIVPETAAARLDAIAYKIDVNTLAHLPATGALVMNDIARVRWKLAQPVCADAYSENRATGAFIVIDETTNDTVGAGMIR